MPELWNSEKRTLQLQPTINKKKGGRVPGAGITQQLKNHWVDMFTPNLKMRSWQRSARTRSAERSMTEVTIVTSTRYSLRKCATLSKKQTDSHLQHEWPQELKASARFWMLTYFFSLARACIWSSTEPCTCSSLKGETQRTWQETLKTCDHWDRKRHQTMSFVECGTWRSGEPLAESIRSIATLSAKRDGLGHTRAHHQVSVACLTESCAATLGLQCSILQVCHGAS